MVEKTTRITTPRLVLRAFREDELDPQWEDMLAAGQQAVRVLPSRDDFLK